MSLSEDETKRSLDILTALDKAIAKGPWEKSLFLRGIGGKLRDARNRFVQELGLDDILNKLSSSANQSQAGEQAASLTTEVYISLYQAEGGNLVKWAGQVESLPKLFITRSVYKTEEDAKAAIRAKAFKNNDAYAVVTIRKVDIMPPFGDKPLVDRAGRELLNLKETSVKIENISRFIHITGEYQYKNNQLIKKGPATGL